MEGHLEGRHYTNGNKPSYLDGTGPNLQYGVDFEFRIPLFTLYKEPIKLMFGADSAGARQGFSQVAGRAGISTPIPIRDMEFGYFHRSEHNMDYDKTNSYRRFFSADFVFLRYNFGRETQVNK
jgi:hypothetical protein